MAVSLFLQPLPQGTVRAGGSQDLQARIPLHRNEHPEVLALGTHEFDLENAGHALDTTFEVLRRDQNRDVIDAADVTFESHSKFLVATLKGGWQQADLEKCGSPALEFTLGT